MPYFNVNEVESAVQALSIAFPNQCELITLPNATIEGRTSHAIRLADGALDDRPAILFIGGQHAREWGSSEVCINFAADVLEAYDANTGLSYGGTSFTAAEIQALLDDTQVFVFPCVNPDGRHHSQTADAMWRKNRRDNGDGTMGVDLNRNYDVLWDFAATFSPTAFPVVSDNPGFDTYHGSAPFSEPETQNVRWMLETYPQIRWFIDIHSFSQLLYTNWGDDENQITDPGQNFLNNAYDGDRGVPGDAYGEYIRPGDLAAQDCLAERMQTALQGVRGITYQTGQSFDLYPTSGTATDYPYSRHFADVTKTKTHGFLIEWGTEFQPPWAEMENIILDVSAALVAFATSAPCTCSEVDAHLATPAIVFNDIPEGETTFRAAVFEVASCREVTFEIIDGPNVTVGPAATTFGTPLGTTDTVAGSPSGTGEARIWISYTGTSDGDTAEGDVTVRCIETEQEWTVPITANTIEAPTAVVALVFDRSNSMTFDSGIAPGVTRGDVLKFSAPPFVDVIAEGNAVAVVQFDHDAQTTLHVKEINNLGDRLAVSGHIGGYMPNPNGWTSIGEGVAEAHAELDPETDYAVKAIVVLTDGRQNHDGYTRQYISDVAALINERVYAVGLGTPDNLEPAALQALCDGHDGYLLITGDLDASATFRLAKYYQQILAGVTNQDVVLDPEGAVRPGQTHRIPFRLTEADYRAEVVLLTPAPPAIRFSLEAPDGTVFTAGSAAGAAVDYGVGGAVAYYRLSLPLPSDSGQAHGGTWHAILDGDRKHYGRYLEHLHNEHSRYESTAAHGVPYSLTARATSNLRLRARLAQSSRTPGATIMLRATLTEYGIPVANRANVRAELVRPGGGTYVLHLNEDEPGEFVTDLTAHEAGVYRFRVLANGHTLRGTPFTREHLLTGAVWADGDRPPPSSDDGGTDSGRETFCRLLRCLLGSKLFRAYAEERGLDVDEVVRCLELVCRNPQKSRGEAQTPGRGGALELDPKTVAAIRELAAQLTAFEGR